MNEPGPNIAKALVEFQAQMPTVAKAQKAVVPTKAGGSYTYTYADLADVSEAAMPLLTKCGLAFSACPQATEGGYELCGKLLHVSGEMLQGVLPIAGRSPQEIGSSITYGRRYLLGSMTGLVTDNDDDGRVAQQHSESRVERLPTTPEGDPWQTPAAEDTTPMTDKTRAHLFVLFSKKGVAEDQQLPGANHILGTAYESRKQITEAQAKRLIAVLNKRPDVDVPIEDPEAKP